MKLGIEHNNNLQSPSTIGIQRAIFILMGFRIITLRIAGGKVPTAVSIKVNQSHAKNSSTILSILF